MEVVERQLALPVGPLDGVDAEVEQPLPPGDLLAGHDDEPGGHDGEGEPRRVARARRTAALRRRREPPGGGGEGDELGPLDRAVLGREDAVDVVDPSHRDHCG